MHGRKRCAAPTSLIRRELELMQTLRENRDCYPISVSFMGNWARALALSTHGHLYSAIEIGSCPIFPKHWSRRCPTTEKQNWQVRSSYVMTLICSSQTAPVGADDQMSWKRCAVPTFLGGEPYLVRRAQAAPAASRVEGRGALPESSLCGAA